MVDRVDGAEALDVPAELLRRMSKPGPRYTSYPTANVFHEGVGPADLAAALGRFGRSGRPLSLYVHLPFCRSLCHYCACNVIVTQKPGVAGHYLDVLAREVELASDAIGARPEVSQLHLGGGTPTFLTSDELRRLHALLAARFQVAADAELSVEVDARVTSREQLATLAELGWNRASFGVQDFSPEVQRAINRLQSEEQTAELVEAARALGYQGINVDLIYGLPFQRAETFAESLAAVLRLRPDRIALYSYAHVPWLRVAQRRFDSKGYPLPGPEEKFALFRQATQALGAAGYRHLGLDHFALPDDELSRALAQGTLHRNFQGYTVRRADDLLGLGVTSISDVDGVYAQNHKELPDYRAAIGAGRLATSRGFVLSPADQERRALILALMTQGELPADLATSYPDAHAALALLAADGLVELGATPRVTPLGRFFLRNVAMPFDQHLAAPGERPVFSRTV